MINLPMIQDLYAQADERAALLAEAIEAKAWNLTARQLCDLELLMNGGFSPLRGFMGEADYNSVLKTMRLCDGSLFPLPICLDVESGFAETISLGDNIALKDGEGVTLALLHVSDKWVADKRFEAVSAFGSDDEAHPAVRYLFRESGEVYLGGVITGLNFITHYDFRDFRHTPNELRRLFNESGWDRVVGFQTRNPLHCAHYELTLAAANRCDAHLLLHPVVGQTKPGDVDHYTRVRCYQAIAGEYPRGMMSMSLLPLAMRMAGPKEALWHAIIRKNYGCSHFIIGRDHAGPGNDSSGASFYGLYDAQFLVAEYADEIGIKIIPFQEMLYVEGEGRYVPQDEVGVGVSTRGISGTELRRRLRDGTDIPDWFSFPSVISELRRTFPARHCQGFTLFFTGLSGAGKSTIAGAVLAKLMELGGRPITFLDGDIVRQHLSSELGFSRAHRDLNVTRIGFVASEVTKNRGIAICAPIAPYAETRFRVREMVECYGNFLEIFVDTPLSVCEARDRKGLYSLVRAGKIKNFTGIDDPYEVPDGVELVLTTEGFSGDECADIVIGKLVELGLIKLDLTP